MKLKLLKRRRNMLTIFLIWQPGSGDFWPDLFQGIGKPILDPIKKKLLNVYRAAGKFPNLTRQNSHNNLDAILYRGLDISCEI